MVKKQESFEDPLLDVIIESIKNKKGKEIVSINLKQIENSVCDYFVICHGDSTTQVSAIVEEVKKQTREVSNTPAHHVEGVKNSQWILVDYGYLVVHVFLPETRNFYRIEDLWSDGLITKYEDKQ